MSNENHGTPPVVGALTVVVIVELCCVRMVVVCPVVDLPDVFCFVIDVAVYGAATFGTDTMSKLSKNLPSPCSVDG